MGTQPVLRKRRNMRVKRATEADFDEEKHQIKKWLQIQKLRKEKNKNEWKKVYGKKRIWMGEEGKAEIIEKGSWGKPKR